jgi:glycerate kinase
MPAVREAEFVVACDVDSPFCGPSGAAYVFAPQKGAGPQMVEDLDMGMCNLAEVIKRVMGKDIRDIPGSGAAGGLGGGFIAFLDARLERGIEMVLEAIGFDAVIAGADLVITGEGRVDSQTLTGKTPYGIMKRASEQGIRTVLVGGTVKLDDGDNISEFGAVYSATPPGMPLEEAMHPETAAENIRNAIAEIMKKS